ncbi:MAG: hypothetical protein HKO71_04035, partial [Pseudomonadales bacterium]|nr:hypothetical protein [Pseudomonadales bacterium]
MNSLLVQVKNLKRAWPNKLKPGRRVVAGAVIALVVGSAMPVNALQLQGERIQGGLLYGQLEVGQKVYYRDTALQLDAQQRFIVALDRDAGPELVLKVRDAKAGDSDCASRTYHYEIARRDYPTQHIEGVAKKYVAPDPEQVARSRREARLVGQARKQQRAQADFFDGFSWPVT